MSGQTVVVHKADPFPGQVIDDYHICIVAPSILVERGDSLDVLAAEFDNDARKLETALHNSLPGGTYDRLLGRMLARKASHFVVSHNLDGVA